MLTRCTEWLVATAELFAAPIASTLVLYTNPRAIKILALLQISWMFIQLGVRLGRNLPTSQLEVLTLSFAICSSITYIMLIDKPQDVRTSYTIKAVRHPSAEDLICMANAGPVGNVFKSNVWIPNDAMHRDAVGKVPGYMISLAYFFAFGATHCVAWNSEFPTAVERLLWRLSSVVTAVALPFVYLILDPFWLKVFKLETQPRLLELVEGSLLILIVGVFILARLFVTVEVVRSFGLSSSRRVYRYLDSEYPACWVTVKSGI